MKIRPLKNLRELFRKTTCDDCGGSQKLDVAENGFDVPLILKCKCEEPIVTQPP